MTLSQLIDHVTAHYVRTIQPIRLSTLCADLKISRKTLNAMLENGGYARLRFVDITVPRYSRDYPGIQMGQTKAAAVQPRAEELARRLAALQNNEVTQ